MNSQHRALRRRTIAPVVNTAGIGAFAGGQVMILICVGIVALVGMIAIVADFQFHAASAE